MIKINEIPNKRKIKIFFSAKEKRKRD